MRLYQASGLNAASAMMEREAGRRNAAATLNDELRLFAPARTRMVTGMTSRAAFGV